jgi:hypothetical protein
VKLLARFFYLSPVCAAFSVLCSLAWGCAGQGGGGFEGEDQGATSPPAPKGHDDGGARIADASTPTTDAMPQTDAPVPSRSLACNEEPPAGASQAAPLPSYAGKCPQLVAGPSLSTITSSGASRSFMLVLPKNLQQTEKLPVLFMWYWLGGSADGMYSKAEVQSAADQQRFLAVIPVAKGDLPFKWPFNIADSDARLGEEFQFFDDMLACVAQQFPTVNRNCVASMGVSAGALFTDQLGSGRANRLSSILSFSGGVGGVIRPWSTPTHQLPAIVLWGGPSDNCFGLPFAGESQSLQTALAQEGSFLIECVHNCGHAEPPVDAPAPGVSRYAAFWNFVFDHPFWLARGDSPYKRTGLPSTFPSWCAIGAGKAIPRTGACPPPGC